MGIVFSDTTATFAVDASGNIKVPPTTNEFNYTSIYE